MGSREYTEEQPLVGLTENEGQERIAAGQVNRADITTEKTTKQIILSNTLTYFNLIFLVLAILLIIAGSFRNLTFLPVVIANTVIGIVQELRAKKTLDKMNMLHAPHAIVLRDGRQIQIASADLVKDDVILLRAGNQICADACVLQGSVAVNESLLTGESDEIRKEPGSRLMSGSFVVSGQCYARLERVGNDSYISRLTAEAKQMGDGEPSEMIRSVNQLIKWVGVIIIPVGAVLFSQAYFMNHETFQKSIISMVAAVTGMIPEGLYLLTTMALVMGTVRLAGRNVLLHDMKSIEALARVDVLCVDKTGTITEPGMQVAQIVAAKAYQEAVGQGESGQDACKREMSGQTAAEIVENLLTDYAAAVPDDNETMQALREYLQKRKAEKAKQTSSGRQTGNRFRAQAVLPFSSSRKYSAVTFAEGSFAFGAPEFIMGSRYEWIRQEIAPYQQKGYRVLLLAACSSVNGDGTLAGEVSPVGFVILSNPLRKNAKKTFAYFKSQKVTVKVISGDNPQTVSEIAKLAGIDHADEYVDAGSLRTEEELQEAALRYTVFGRVTPRQKRLLVQALQNAGHTVAMTGDGVNDILAMKDADCSIAMASGSEAAAQAAQAVLLDSDFGHMPDVVAQGRQVVNNIQRSASLFLVKNTFSLLMALFSAVFAITYPLEPSQISLISMFTIGVPGFLLAMEPNRERIRGHFMTNVMLRALPAGITDALAVGALVTCGEVFRIPGTDIATASTMLLSAVGFMILIKISQPFNKAKYAIVIGNICGLIFCGIFLGQLFAISAMSRICVLLMIVFTFAAESLFRYLTILAGKVNKRHNEK